MKLQENPQMWQWTFTSVERGLQWLPQRTQWVPGSSCPGTVEAFSRFQLLRNMEKLHAVGQLNIQGGKMAESEKIEYYIQMHY